MKPLLTTVRKFTDSLAFMDLPVFDYIDSDDFAIVRMEQLGMELPYQTPIFRPDHYSIIVVVEGTVTYFIGNSVFELSQNCILFSRPDSFLASKWSALGKAYTITFSKKFLLQHWPSGIDEIQKLENSKNCIIKLADKMMKSFETTCLEIYNEAISKEPYKHELITNLIFNLLLLIRQEQFGNKSEDLQKKYNAYVTNFINDIEDNFSKIASGHSNTLLHINDYAKKQNLNESTLSKIVSTATGKSVNQWIHEKLIEDIQYLLKYTDKPMRDIATLYGFYDLNYFYNYFKRHTQNAPGTFRRDFSLM
ncbi:helix-turn-helix transcriptional regulator [Flavobacterium sp. LC2016-01]|uniref:AraC family transcriptional regulator n=1 Tax=Flavobacterium sp. LC2016-01 TaxID=2675876 RepID=UPI0012BAE5B1|nr:helix-turn-helix transcriptional regulator [Flavobacterium sp. LC2016-01]MTH17714.1 helix-turn-helix domain-containing protein [Flavobacterium sp. LC2016-01]